MKRSFMDITIKRVYAEPCEDDGVSILVDRLWPKGLTKESARVERKPAERRGIDADAQLDSKLRRPNAKANGGELS
jgi:hypothetical protein